MIEMGKSDLQHINRKSQEHLNNTSPFKTTTPSLLGSKQIPELNYFAMKIEDSQSIQPIEENRNQDRLMKKNRIFIQEESFCESKVPKVSKRYLKTQILIYGYTSLTQLIVFMSTKEKNSYKIRQLQRKSSYEERKFYVEIDKEKAKDLNHFDKESIKKYQILSDKEELQCWHYVSTKNMFQMFRKQFFTQKSTLLLKYHHNFLPIDKLYMKSNFEKYGFKTFIIDSKIMIIDKLYKKPPPQESREKYQKMLKEEKVQLLKGIVIDMKVVQKENDYAEKINKMEFIINKFSEDQRKLQKCFQIYSNSNPRRLLQIIFLQGKQKQLVEFIQYTESINCLSVLFLNPDRIIIDQKPSSNHVQILQNISIEYLIINVNQQLRRNNPFALTVFWETQFSQQIKNVFNNPQMYGPLFYIHLEHLTLLIQYQIMRYTYFRDDKIQVETPNRHHANLSGQREQNGINERIDYKMQIFQLIYPGINHLLDQLQTFMKKISGIELSLNLLASQYSNSCNTIKGYKQFLKKPLEIQSDNLSVQLIDLFMQEKYIASHKKMKVIVSYVNMNSKLNKIYLSQFMAQKVTEFTIQPQLRDLFTKISHIIEHNTKKQKKQISAQEQCRIKKEHQIKGTVEQPLWIENPQMHYFNNLAKQKLQQTKCLGCSPFFFYWTNILDQTINTVPVSAFSSIQRMKDHEQEIKDEICTMLNSGGGILLFDCQQYYNKMLVKGHFLTEKQKQLYEQRFASYLEVFEPKTEAKKSFKISFVPVFENPFQNEQKNYDQIPYTSEQGLIKPHQRYKSRPYIKGTYVMRIRINPINPTTVFFWSQNTNAQIQDRYKNYVLSTKKNKVKFPLKMKNLARQIKKKMKNYYLPQSLSHQENKILAKPFSYFDHECRAPETIPVVTDPTGDDSGSRSYRQRSFDYSSMIIAKKSNLHLISKTFKSQGIEVRTETKFEKYKLKAAQHSAIMYHNIRFDQLYKATHNNHRFSFGGKALLLISITNYLKLQYRNEQYPLNFDQFCKLVQWIRKQFPYEGIKAFEFRTGQRKEYFIECQSQESTLFSYYILNSHFGKTNFKNPMHLDKMSEPEKKTRLILLFQENGISEEINLINRSEKCFIDKQDLQNNNKLTYS